MDVLSDEGICDQFKHLSCWNGNVVPCLPLDHHGEGVPVDVVVDVRVLSAFLMVVACTCKRLDGQASIGSGIAILFVAVVVIDLEFCQLNGWQTFLGARSRR